MNKLGPVRRRRDAEETRRRVLDTVIATVNDVGYYKASSNEIARRAGVTWGSIQHQFGSREELMMEVANHLRKRHEPLFTGATIVGSLLEDRLRDFLRILSTHHEQGNYLVLLQIILDLSANPRTSKRDRNAIRRQNRDAFDRLARPMLSQVLGVAAKDNDLVLFAFVTLRGYLISSAISQRIADLPDGVVLRFVSDDTDEPVLRDLLIRGIAAVIREEAARRGYTVD